MPPDYFDQAALSETRAFNRKLAWLPRFKIRNRITPLFIQSLLRVAQVGGSRRVTAKGINVERLVVSAGGVSVPVRILRPKGAVRGVVLDIHGGGWVIGNAQMNDGLNAAMCVACNVAVVSVDYRLAVSAPVEALMDDCLAAARWLLEGGPDGYGNLHVFIVGESAGGHLAAATLLQLKAWPELLSRVKGAILYYGVYDLTGTESVRQAGPETLVLDGPGMVAALRLLTPGRNDEERRMAPLSPLYGDLQGMPPALMFVGGQDPLRDDTTEMAKRWKEVADVEVHLVPDAPHGFIHFPTRLAKQTLRYSHEWMLALIGASRVP